MTALAQQDMAAMVDGILEFEGRKFQPGNPAAGDPCDKYGITSITLGRWRKLGRDATPAEVEALSESEARAVYAQWYVIDPGFGGIRDTRLRQFVVDFGVNSSVERSAWYLQKAAGVHPDMDVGPLTLAAVNAADPALLLMRLVRARVEVLVRWIRAKPEARGRYAAVITRAVSFLPALTP